MSHFLSISSDRLCEEREQKYFIQCVREIDSGILKLPRVWGQKKSDGSFMNVELTLHRVVWKDTDGLMVMVNDISSRLSAGRQMRQLANVINNSSIVSRTDSKGVILEVNTNFVNISKYNRDELVGRTHRVINSGYHEKAFWVEMWQTILQGKPWRREVKNRAKDGSFYWVDTFVYPLNDETGAINGFLSVRNDITQNKQNEYALLEKNNLIDDFFSSINEGFLILDSAFNVVFYNEAFLNCCNHSGDLRGKSVYVICPELATEQSAAGLETARRKGEPVQFEIALPRGVYGVIATPGKSGLFVYFQDITLRRQNEEEIRKLALIARHTTNAIIITNETGEIEWVNDGFTRISEYSLEEVAGRKPADFLQGDETDLATVALMREAVLARTPFHVEIINYSKSGRKYWMDIDCVPLFEKGRHTGFIAIELEITGLKTLVASLNESENKFRTLTHESGVGILLQGLNDEILFCNPAALDLLGLSEDQILGKSSYDDGWKVIHEDGTDFLPDDRPSVKALRSGETVSNIKMGVYHPVKDDWVWVLTSAVPLHNDTGEITSVIVALTNISREKEYQRTLMQSIREKEFLIKEIHHRVKNNLQLISSMLYLKMHDSSTEDAKEFLTAMREKIRSVSLIHERLLQTERLDSIDIAEYLKSLLKDIQAAYKVHNLQLRIETEIEKIFFSTDNAMFIGQLVNEIVINAMKHAFRNKKEGLIRVMLNEQGRDYLLIIDDDGIGLPEDLDPANSTSYGMRLLLIFTSQLKGKLSIERNGGTKFIIQFPALQSPVDLATA